MRTFKVRTIDDHPHYVTARKALHSEDLVRFKKLKKNIELSQEEKKVLIARDFIHKQEWNKALELIEKMGMINSEYLNAEMYAIKTYVLHILARPEEALWANQRSLFYYELCGDQEGLFRSHYNRAVTLERFQQFQLMDFHYQEARKHTHSPHQIIHILKAEAFIQCRLGQVDQAIARIKEALTFENDLEKTHFDNLKTVASEIYIKAGKIKMAKQILEELAASKINPERARVLAELKMLEVLQDGTKMKEAPSTIKKNQEWYLKWQTIQALQTGEGEKAQELWNKLVKKYPALFSKNFLILDPLEEKTAFGLLLKAIYRKESQEGGNHRSLSKVDHLLWLLENSPISQRKEDLIEAVWGEAYDPKFDARFYKLIQRAKKISDVENVGGVYYLKTKTNKSA